MEHYLDAADGPLQSGPLQDAAGDEVDPATDRVQAGREPARQVIQDHDLVPAVDERPDEVMTDESSAAGDERPHPVTSWTRTGRSNGAFAGPDGRTGRITLESVVTDLHRPRGRRSGVSSSGGLPEVPPDGCVPLIAVTPHH